MSRQFSDYERLVQELNDVRDRERRVQRELRETLEKKDQAEARVQEAQRKKDQAEARERKAQREKGKATQNTTLCEYLHYNYIYLSKTFLVQREKTKSTGGTTTKTDGIYYPTTLRHWDDFLPTQRVYLDTICNVCIPYRKQ